MKTLYWAFILIFSCSCGQTLTGAKDVSMKSGENSVDTTPTRNSDNTVVQPEVRTEDMESSRNSDNTVVQPEVRTEDMESSPSSGKTAVQPEVTAENTESSPNSSKTAVQPEVRAEDIESTASSDPESLVAAAMALTLDDVTYDGRYFSIAYPNGDVPSHIGVCTDVVIRAYRKLGIDLQKEVHEDMVKHFNLYPKKWGLKKTDKNIDHRRVPNLMTYFKRFGKEKAISEVASDYQPGDIVCWMLPGNLTHIGVVVNRKSRDGKRYMIVHNIGGGQVLEDCLFDFKIIGHYAY